MKKYLGIDLGGTNVRVAKVDEEGKIESIVDAPSHALEGPEKVLEVILELIGKTDMKGVEGIGIGVPGPVDEKTNRMTMSTNIPGMDNYPLAEKITEVTGKKVVMNNDANVAGVAEAHVGAGKGYKIVYYITHSTGIGGALVINGHIVTGRNGYAGEIANIVVKQADASINHLNPGAVENEASGTAIGRKGKEIFGEDGDTAYKVFELCRAGNEKAAALIDEASRLIALMMADIACVCAPDCFVIGGGCSKAHDLYFDRIRRYLNYYVHTGNADIPVLLAECPEPGVIGAALLAKTEI